MTSLRCALVVTLVLGASMSADSVPLGALATRDAAQVERVVVAADGTVVASNLFDNREPDGFGRGTTGGLGGRVYVVTSTADTEVYGTLRYGVEQLPGPRWIVFHPTVFPATVKTSIDLQRPLLISGQREGGNDLTIDGRGSWVSLRRSISWDDMLEDWYVAGTSTRWDPNDDTTIAAAYECHEKDNVGPIVQIRSARNIIITHVDFAKVRTGTPPPTPTSYEWLDDQCFDDMITVYNGELERASTHYDKIWINNSEFRNCGDECVTVYSASTAGLIAGVTVSRNLFANTNKGLMIGGGPQQYGIAVSVYQNRFVNTSMRQPRVEGGYAHVFNNLYENWVMKAIDARDYSRVMVEQNVFRSVTTTRGAWQYSGAYVSLWSRDNVLSTSAITGTSKSGFPACSSLGGPWYYDCSVRRYALATTSYATARDWVRARSGWKPVRSDVRDAVRLSPLY